MQQFEKDYAELVQKVYIDGDERQTRNAITRSLFGMQLKIDTRDSCKLALIQGRKMYPKGVLGELAAILRQPKHIKQFEEWGCNYWKQWAQEDGFINIDYGNAWFADEQIARLKDKLANDPYDRRMLINGWRPYRLEHLDLPCCHYAYQFHVTSDGYLNMVWIQRSVDMMIGLPSDILFAHAWLIAIANQFGYKTGVITMQLGDCHIYEQHYTGIQPNSKYTALKLYLTEVEARADIIENEPHYIYTATKGKDFCEFDPRDLLITDHDCGPKLELELYS